MPIDSAGPRAGWRSRSSADSRRSATNVGRAASADGTSGPIVIRPSTRRFGRARIDGEVRGDAGRREAGLGRVVGDVDLEQDRQRPPRPTLAGEAVEALGEREAVDGLDRGEQRRRHGRPCWTGAGPTRCHVPPDVAGILSAASWTRFSPSTSSPASIADWTRGAATVFETATSVTSAGSRPARAAAVAMRSRTAARAAAKRATSSRRVSRRAKAPSSVPGVRGRAARARR